VGLRRKKNEEATPSKDKGSLGKRPSGGKESPQPVAADTNKVQ